MKESRLLKITLLLIVAPVIGGCAVGQTLDYKTGSVDYNTGLSDEVHIVITFNDIRPYVLSGNKKPSFVGLSRSLYGIPYPVNTKSGNALSDDFGKLIVNSLILKGLDAEFIAIPLRGDVSDFVKQNATSGTRVLVFDVAEWKTDASFTASIHYNVTLSVYGESGQKLATVNRKGVDQIGPKVAPGRRSLAEVNVDIIGGLLGSPEIKRAVLNNEPVVVKTKTVLDDDKTPSAQKDTCTVQQILSMKETGMTDGQVEAACQ